MSTSHLNIKVDESHRQDKRNENRNGIGNNHKGEDKRSNGVHPNHESNWQLLVNFLHVLGKTVDEAPCWGRVEESHRCSSHAPQHGGVEVTRGRHQAIALNHREDDDAQSSWKKTERFFFFYKKHRYSFLEKGTTEQIL